MWVLQGELESNPRTIVMSELMGPQTANLSGNVHGGHLLLLLDKVAYVCAARYAGHSVVTLSVDQVFFKQPIYVGEVVFFYAMVNYVGRTSMEIGIKVVAENLLTHEKRHTNSCYFTMVAVDKNGHPAEVPALVLNNEIDCYRFEEAKLRKEQRLVISKHHKENKNRIRGF